MISAITCMAVAIYFEARNQPVAGQLAKAPLPILVLVRWQAGNHTGL